MSALIPRLEMNDLDPALAKVLEPRVKRLGYLGEFFKCSGHQPAATVAFMNYTEALTKAVPGKLTELVAMTVTKVAGNVYEQNQHERLAEKLGFGRDWIAAVVKLAPDTAPGLDESERDVQRLALAAARNYGHGVAAELDAVAKAVGPSLAVAVLLLIGRYLTHSMIVNALELEPPVPSIF